MNVTMPSEQAARTGATAPAARIVNGVKVYGAGVTAVRALDGVSADFGAGLLLGMIFGWAIVAVLRSRASPS